MRIEQMPVVPVPAHETPKIEALKHRIEAAVAREEGQQEQLLALAQQIERRVAMLRALLPFAADPATEEVLRAVLPAIEVASPLPPEVRPEPPQQITERVQVTRQLVLAATQTFDNTFTVNDVLSLMSGGRQIDGEERLRVRSAIAQAMTTLYERGELVKEAEGIGKRQTIWRKVALKGSGNGNRTRG